MKLEACANVARYREEELREPDRAVSRRYLLTIVLGIRRIGKTSALLPPPPSSRRTLIGSFFDKNYGTDRFIRRSRISLCATPDGKIRSFCTYNSLHRNDVKNSLQFQSANGQAKPGEKLMSQYKHTRVSPDG
jgi:hypothetical protein